MIYLRIAAALAILGLLWGAVHVWNKAQRLDVVEAEYAQFKADRQKFDKDLAERDTRAERRSEKLATTVEGVRVVLADLRANPPTNTVKYVQKPGDPCPVASIDEPWLRNYNAASDASTVRNPR